jgi:hypothetical protein
MIRALLDRVRDHNCGNERVQHRAVETDLSVSTDVDTALDTLANPRRRNVIHRLADLQENEPGTAPEMDISDLAKYIAALEGDAASVDDTSGDARQRVYIALYQSHLPTLDRHGIIQYDERAGVVRPGPDVVALSTLLTIIEGACANAGGES